MHQHYNDNDWQQNGYKAAVDIKEHLKAEKTEKKVSVFILFYDY